MRKSITLTELEWDALWEAAWNTLGLRSEGINEEPLERRLEFNQAVSALNKVGKRIGYKNQNFTARETNKSVHNLN